MVDLPMLNGVVLPMPNGSSPNAERSLRPLLRAHNVLPNATRPNYRGREGGREGKEEEEKTEKSSAPPKIVVETKKGKGEGGLPFPSPSSSSVITLGR